QICVVETKPPAGYTDNFDASAPPAVCGTVPANSTLRLTLTNTANRVPIHIQAGGGPVPAAAVASDKPDGSSLLIIFGALLLASASGVIAARAARR
ncbi:MAG: hypothetical protein J2O49_10275, partial [Sciscionella sp.]|nr:hypothetical protein [Sciscionella sp.]